jgi:hypothetical protein
MVKVNDELNLFALGVQNSLNAAFMTRLDCLWKKSEKFIYW